jgi:hypothetical protein
MYKLIFLLCPCVLFAQQDKASIDRILERLDKLEQENAQLREEVQRLREKVDSQTAAERPDVKERLDVQERRIEEQAQTKVEASQRFPMRVTGMALFNAFWGGRNSGGQDIALSASPSSGPAVAGATLRQTVLGLQFDGPVTIGGGRLHGSLFADFFSGLSEANPIGNTARIRTGSIEISWKRRSLLFGQEKPIFAPREPNSLAVVGVSPLTGAGNLWRWHPQFRYEERIPFSGSTQLTAQIGVFQTQEDLTLLPPQIAPTIARRRPGLQGRFELAHEFDEERRLEFAPGFHSSTTHAGNFRIPSRVFSLDWFVNPFNKLQFKGAFFDGENLAHFGALRQSISQLPDGSIVGVRSRGGWGQLTVLATDRITWNLLGGIHDDRDADLRIGNIGQNRAGASNLMFRLAPNVLLSIEAMQVRTRYLGAGRRINNRYDLAVAYQF